MIKILVVDDSKSMRQMVCFTLKTAGSTTNFDMTFCPKPMVCGRYINNIVDGYRDDHSFKKSDIDIQETVKKIVS